MHRLGQAAGLPARAGEAGAKQLHPQQGGQLGLGPGRLLPAPQQATGHQGLLLRAVTPLCPSLCCGDSFPLLALRPPSTFTAELGCHSPVTLPVFLPRHHALLPGSQVSRRWWWGPGTPQNRDLHPVSGYPASGPEKGVCSQEQSCVLARVFP